MMRMVSEDAAALPAAGIHGKRCTSRHGNASLIRIMLVSVVIPTRQRPETTVRAVASVLGQTHGELECIVVDDGSGDDTLERLARIGDERLNLVPREHGGVSAARNTGIARARGGHIALLDSDDWWEPAKLERQLAAMTRHGWDICQTDETWIRHGRRVNPGKIHRKRGGEIFEASLELCLVSPSAVMLTREIWEESGPFDETLPACEDYDLWLRILLRRPIEFLPERLVVKTGGHDQLSRSIRGLDLFRIRSLLKVRGLMDVTDPRRAALDRELARKARIYVRGCLKRGREVEAMRVRELVETELGPLFP
jgi:glycosyltransferase involved in cell wall biosynthesis